MLRRQSGSTLFPYTTLFRSSVVIDNEEGGLARGLKHKEKNGDEKESRAEMPKMEVQAAGAAMPFWAFLLLILDRKSTRLNSSHVAISYAVFCLKKKNKKTRN